jgi:hypothetical protein
MQITIASSTLASIVQTVSDTVWGASGLIVLVIAVPALFYIGKRIIGMLPRSSR